MALEVVRASLLRASTALVWARVSTFEGVNDELGPLIRMTAPVGTCIDEDVPLGRTWFRSRLLLFGVLPVDYDDLAFDRVEPGRGFHERSTMRSMSVWEHERTLEQRGDGCLVLDRLRFVPRIPLPAALLRAIVGWVFDHRHRRLRRRFGGDRVDYTP